MDFVFVYELSNREFDNLVLLKRELVRRGHNVELMSKYCQMKIRHRKFVLLAPNCYRQCDIDHYTYAYNARNNPIVVYPNEQVVNKQMPAFFDPSDENKAKFLPTLCWGKEYYEFINELGYKNKYNQIVGALHLDFCNPRFAGLYKSREEIAEQYKLLGDHKWLLFISDFVFSNIDMSDHYIKEGSMSETAVLSMRAYEAELQSTIMEWFDDFLDKNDEYIVIYRKHPVEIKADIVSKAEKKHPGRFFEISELNIKQWIMISDKICTYNSTAVVECTAAGKNCVLLRPKEFPEESGVKEYIFFRDYPRVKKKEEFTQAILEDKSDLEMIRRNISHLYSMDDKLTYEKMADALEAIAKENYTRNCDLSHYYRDLIKFHLRTRHFLYVPLKYIYRKFGKALGYPRGREGFRAIKEWIAVENNGKHERELGAKIDKMIAD